jgi:hypothetical protein
MQHAEWPFLSALPLECGHDEIGRRQITRTTGARRGDRTVSEDVAAADQNGRRGKGAEVGRKPRVIQIPLLPG